MPFYNYFIDKTSPSIPTTDYMAKPSRSTNNGDTPTVTNMNSQSPLEEYIASESLEDTNWQYLFAEAI